MNELALDPIRCQADRDSGVTLKQGEKGMASMGIQRSFKTRRAKVFMAITLIALSGCTSATPADRSVHALPAQAASVQGPQPAVSKNPADDSTSPMVLSAGFNASHALHLQFGAASLDVTATACSQFTDTLSHCTKDVSIMVDDPHRQLRQTLHPEQVWINNQSTFYRGSLSETNKPRAGEYSIIWGDASGDGEPDLIVQTGKDGSYGGPSFDVYVYDRATHQLVYNKSLSELTVGHNSLFSMDNGMISASTTSGCCEHVRESYRFAEGQLTLIKRSTETRK